MTEQRAGARVACFDILRGFTIVSMVLFHLCYDLAYIAGVDMPWFVGTMLQTVWRASISWTFLFLAGWMTSFSHNNLRRGMLYGACALAVFLVTTAAQVDTSISFGILFCMAASTLIYAALQHALVRINPVVGTVVALSAFLVTLSVPQGTYDVEGFAWLGFPSPGFASGDYYPLIPYTFMYLAGARAARWFDTRHPDGYPRWMHQNFCPALNAIGTKSLVIYLLHQPVLLALTMLLV